MNKEKPNEQIELARQSGYNEACYVFEKKVEKLKEEFKNFNYEGYYIPKRKKLELQKIIDKIMGEFELKETKEDFNKNKDIKGEYNKELETARRCLHFKGCYCENKDCLNEACPLNSIYNQDNSQLSGSQLSKEKREFKQVGTQLKSLHRNSPADTHNKDEVGK